MMRRLLLLLFGCLVLAGCSAEQVLALPTTTTRRRLQHYKPPSEENVKPFRPTDAAPTVVQDGNSQDESIAQGGGNDESLENDAMFQVDETQENNDNNNGDNNNNNSNNDPEAIARGQLASENSDSLGVGPAVMIGVGGAAVLLAAGYFTMRPK